MMADGAAFAAPIAPEPNRAGTRRLAAAIPIDSPHDPFIMSPAGADAARHPTTAIPDREAGP